MVRSLVAHIRRICRTRHLLIRSNIRSKNVEGEGGAAGSASVPSPHLPFLSYDRVDYMIALSLCCRSRTIECVPKVKSHKMTISQVTCQQNLFRMLTPLRPLLTHLSILKAIDPIYPSFVLILSLTPPPSLHILFLLQTRMKKNNTHPLLSRSSTNFSC